MKMKCGCPADETKCPLHGDDRLIDLHGEQALAFLDLTKPGIWPGGLPGSLIVDPTDGIEVTRLDRPDKERRLAEAYGSNDGIRAEVNAISSGGVVRDQVSAIIDEDAIDGRGSMEMSAPPGPVYAPPVRDRVVVTRYLGVGAVRPIVHVYGPYTSASARLVRQELIDVAIRDGYSARLEASTCQLMSDGKHGVRDDVAL